MIGKTINNYLIERKLGDGGMGEVFYAKHNKVDREVAIKVLHSHLFSNESIHNRFKNEANALIKLNHPNIVKIYDYVEQDNFACLIMEYINGYTLDSYIKKISGPLPSAKASMIICSVLDAVQYAHNSNVYHRDIKPANIMISADGSKVRIMDFGIAKLTDSKNFKTTHANTQLGTPFYMSPEQIKGLPYARTSDIYSLGVTLFEMVTGKCPYQKINSLFELQSKIVNEPLPPTDLYVPGVSEKIQHAIIKATQKNPDSRFQSCDEFKRYLLDFDATIIAISESKPGGHKTGKRNEWVWYLPGGVILLSVLIAVLIHLSNKPSTKPPLEQPGKNTETIKSKQPIDTLTIIEQKNLVKEQNLVILDNYFNSKKTGDYYELKAGREESIRKEVDTLAHYASIEEFKSKYDKYFIKRVQLIIPNDARIRNDFLEEMKKLIGSIPCIIPLDNIDQIKITSVPIFPTNGKDIIEIIIKYDMYEDVNYGDPEDCSLKLTYFKSGNAYKLKTN
jgi:serine/threonine protein kinase